MIWAVVRTIHVLFLKYKSYKGPVSEMPQALYICAVGAFQRPKFNMTNQDIGLNTYL